MLRKIWNTLRNGDAKTRGFLITVAVLFLATTGLAVAAIVQHSVLIGLTAVALGIITFAVMKDVKLSVVEGDGATGAGGKRKSFRRRMRQDNGKKRMNGNLAEMPLPI